MVNESNWCVSRWAESRGRALLQQWSRKHASHFKVVRYEDIVLETDRENMPHALADRRFR